MSSGLLRRVALVRTDVSEEPGAFETSVLTRATQHNNPEDTILHVGSWFPLATALGMWRWKCSWRMWNISVAVLFQMILEDLHLVLRNITKNCRNNRSPSQCSSKLHACKASQRLSNYRARVCLPRTVVGLSGPPPVCPSQPTHLLLRKQLFAHLLILFTLIMKAIGQRKRRFLQEPQGVTSKKMTFFIVTAVKNSNFRII
jgi:hypothetical protein